MSDKEHLIKAEVIHRLKPYYEPDHHSLFEKVLHLVTSPFHHHYHPVIDTSNYEHKPLSDFSERQVVSRTVFALKKIKEFNHHFFPPQEERLLTGVPAGIISRSVLWACCGVNALAATVMYRNRYFGVKSLMFFGGLLAAEYFIIRTPNFINEIVATVQRRSMARRYIDAYGAEFFHNIIDPRYDVEHLRHLHNKLLPQRHGHGHHHHSEHHGEHHDPSGHSDHHDEGHKENHGEHHDKQAGHH
jgi:hypothetical protein